MTLLQCGCEQDGSARCAEHETYSCHWPCEPPCCEVTEGICPPCRIAKWRSVSLSSAATPTRGKA